MRTEPPIRPAADSGPLKATAAALWSEALADARELQAADPDPYRVVFRLADTVDRIIRDAVAAAQGGTRVSSEPWAICAMGGYGRRHLHRHSDIDLMILFPGRPTSHISSVAESVLYLLWDLGFTVGHASRSVADCVRIGREDVTVRTNLLDLRLVAGDADFFANARRTLVTELHRYRRALFADAKIAEMQARRERFGNTAYLLEPNLKEGPGGLRDLHTVYWIARTAFESDNFSELYQRSIFEQEEVAQLNLGLARLMQIRNWIHFLSDRPHDRLTFQTQEEVAQALGYTDDRSELKSEAFMRHYYELSRENVQAVDSACDTCVERLRMTSRQSWFRRKAPLGDGFYRYRDRIYGTAAALAEKPYLSLRAFRLAQRHGLPLSYELQKSLRQQAPALRSMDPDQSATAAREFCEIVTGPDASTILGRMNDVGVLRAFLPEFEHLYCRVQHDTYHIYTADVHLFFCLRAYADLRAGNVAEQEPELTEIAAALEDPLVAGLAVLLHDIGKGYGEDHSVKGAELCQGISARLGLSPERGAALESLVRNHLLMSHVAQRRDLSDPLVIREFASAVGHPEMLKMLTVLTYCDQSGVGPGVWTPWKRSLLLKLYGDARRVLEREDIQGMYQARIRSRKAQIRRILGRGRRTKRIDRFLNEMAPRFFLRHDVDVAVETYKVFAQVDGGDVAAGLVRVPGVGTYVILGESDRPGLFAFHAGLFRSLQISIVDAEAYVMRGSQIAVNLFLVEPADPLFFEQPDRVARLQQILLHHMRARSPEIEAQVGQHASGATTRPRSRRRIRVRVDLDLSETCTVIEVFGWDRIGLLQDIAHVFFRHGLTIVIARIHTEGQRVSDVFYLQNTSGEKVCDRALLDAIQRDLLDVICD